MCVDPQHPGLNRSHFLGGFAAAASIVAMPLSSEALDPSATLPLPQTAMTSGNARAARIASSSAFVRTVYSSTLDLADRIADTELRASVIDLLRDPKPTFMRNYATPESRTAMFATFAREKFVDASVTQAGLFPPNSDPLGAPQPFWSAPGSGNGSHHAYPGGLAVHECFNATIATHYVRTYDDLYFAGRSAVSYDLAIGAALFHDAMKSIVFQWNDDGTPFSEATICGTGAHHVLSGAEAISRGRSATFVIALLSAHAAPSLGDEDKVVTWCRAAALLAGVDPLRYGLLRLENEAYRLAPKAVPIEAFVNYLSDHDYVLSVHAMHAVRSEFGRRDVDPWSANTILARRSAIELYRTLSDSGERGFDREVDALLREL